MALKKLQLKPGLNRERTRYTNEGGWYDCDKVRFRQGYPEQIGGWEPISSKTFLGVCRSLWSWVTLGSIELTGVGTNLKFYIESGGDYNDITPLRDTVALTNPFETVSGSTTVTVTDADGGYINGDFVTFSGAAAVGGLTLNGEFQILTATTTTYTIEASIVATSTATGGGAGVSAAYQIKVGPESTIPIVGWGASAWGDGAWGEGLVGDEALRLWSQGNFGEDLIFGPKGEPVYYWDATSTLTSRAVALSSLAGANEVPLSQNLILISDINRFVFVFGTNEVFDTAFDPMVIRWSDQENAVEWEPLATNQAGSLRLSRGSEIVAAIQSRQEILVWTDSALYSLQFVGSPAVWSTTLVGENISIVSQNAVGYSNGTVFWMGRDKFYTYNGRTQPLVCDIRKFVFDNLNKFDYPQVFAGINERFHEVWWFYTTGDSSMSDRYVVYNHVEGFWYYGTMNRSAWSDSGLRNYPISASSANTLVNHEIGTDDNVDGVAVPMRSYIQSSEFDIDDGNSFSFIWRVLPDVAFDGSTAEAPSLLMSLFPMANPGAGYNDPLSVGGVNARSVVRSATLPIQQFTGQINTRVRGRQMSFRVESSDLGVMWQLGSPSIDIRPDGRR